jgi:phage-related protein
LATNVSDVSAPYLSSPCSGNRSPGPTRWPRPRAEIQPQTQSLRVGIDSALRLYTHQPGGACTFYGTLYQVGWWGTSDDPQPQKVPLIFYRTAAGSEPVRDWLRGLDESERQAIGKDLLRAQWRWPVGMPLCRPMGSGLWEVRTELPTKRTARVLFCLYREHLVALHGFIKKTRATPYEDLTTARKRQKELER